MRKRKDRHFPQRDCGCYAKRFPAGVSPRGKRRVPGKSKEWVKPTAARSQLMSRVRSSGNHTTELLFIQLLRIARISGWRRGSLLPGRPDFVFVTEKVAVHVDGCFWHGCAVCNRRLPVANRTLWAEKISGNRARDRRVDRQLRARGWSVVRVWEHELRVSRDDVVRRLVRSLRQRP